MFGKFSKIAIMCLVILISTILLFEICYRFYLIDFYNVENNYFNNPDIKKKKTILFFGDSFTASNNNYISMLSDSFPESNIINAAVPGIGIRETSIFASTRIKQYKPDIVVFQVYTGNDFTDIKHDLNFNSLSLIRNLYWYFSDKFLGIRYINYKLGQFKKTEHYHFKEKENFDSKSFNPQFHGFSIGIDNLIMADPVFGFHGVPDDLIAFSQGARVIPKTDQFRDFCQF